MTFPQGLWDINPWKRFRFELYLQSKRMYGRLLGVIRGSGVYAVSYIQVLS